MSEPRTERHRALSDDWPALRTPPTIPRRRPPIIGPLFKAVSVAVGLVAACAVVFLLLASMRGPTP